MTEVMELVQRAPHPPEKPLAAGISPNVLAAAERRIGMRLPGAVRRWLLRTNGPLVGPGGFCGIWRSERSLDIERLVSEHPVWRRNGWIPVASDGCGNYYLTLNGEDDPPVGFWEATCSDNVSYVVASSFLLFIRLLLEKESGKHLRWPFSLAETQALDPGLLSLRDQWPLPFSL